MNSIFFPVPNADPILNNFDNDDLRRYRGVGVYDNDEEENYKYILDK